MFSGKLCMHSNKHD